MTFKQRELGVQFILRKGALDDGQSTILDMSGHRAEAIIDNPGGGLAIGMLHMRIFGMRLSDMNSFSTDGLNALAVRGDQVTVTAGDVGGRVQTVFEGTILSAYIDFGASPEVAFTVSAQIGRAHV